MIAQSHEVEESVEDDDAVSAATTYLTFVVAEETYAVPITCVVEIVGIQEFTNVPDDRPFMRGVINLRGTVIPIMDVRIRLEMEPSEVDGRTCIIVVQTHDLSVGLLVDTISDVIDIRAVQVEEAPKRGATRACASVVTGLVQMDGEVRILIDVDRLLGPTDQQAIDDA